MTSLKFLSQNSTLTSQEKWHTLDNSGSWQAWEIMVPYFG